MLSALQGGWIRILFSRLLSLALVVLLTFVIMHTIPGDPFHQEQALPKEIHEALRDHFGLNDTLLVQFGRHVWSVITWDLGPSFSYAGRSVNAIINEGFAVSALLGIEAFCLAIAGGVTLGALSALWKNRWQDSVVLMIATLGVSIPSFILGTLFQYFLAYQLGWFPIARWGTFSHTILPALALAAAPCGVVAGLLRANMIDVMQSNFIRAAQARGLPRGRLILKHALRNALLPVLSYAGPLLANVLVGSFVIEKIFAIPGLGQWYVDSVLNRDYTVIMGITVFYSILLLSTVAIVDILYAWVDPRIRSKEGL